MRTARTLLYATLLATAAVALAGAQTAPGPPAPCELPKEAEITTGRLISCSCLPTTLKRRPADEPVSAPGVGCGAPKRRPPKAQPAYPPEALARKVSGTVLLSIGLDEGGRVSDVSVVSGPPLLRRVSVEAACNTWYNVEGLSEQERRKRYSISYNFVLQ